jgi:hypothetical protein
MSRTKNQGATAAHDAAGVEASVESALDCLGAHKRLVSVAIYERPLPTTLLKLVLVDWVSHIGLDELHDDGFAALRAESACRKRWSEIHDVASSPCSSPLSRLHNKTDPAQP